jgi:hypothetical protein
MLKILLLEQSWPEMPRKALHELEFKLYDFHNVGALPGGRALRCNLFTVVERLLRFSIEALVG